VDIYKEPISRRRRQETELLGQQAAVAGIGIGNAKDYGIFVGPAM